MVSMTDVSIQAMWTGMSKDASIAAKGRPTPVNADADEQRKKTKSWWQRPSCLVEGTSAPARFLCFFALGHLG